MIRRFMLLIICIVAILSVGGVYAIWEYAEVGVIPVSHTINIRVSEFDWIGSGDLPTDNIVGENHIALIDMIINHPDHGLNKSNSYLNEQIDDRKKGGLLWGSRDTLGSMAVTQSDELNEIFGLTSYSLDFLIQFQSDTEYYIFTTGVDLGERGEINWLGNNKTPGKPTVPIGENIYPIYRTKVIKENGTWRAVETKVGYAKSAWYEESRSNANATQIPSFDPDTFTEGVLQ